MTALARNNFHSNPLKAQLMLGFLLLFNSCTSFEKQYVISGNTMGTTYLVKIVAPDNGKVILIGDYFYAGNYIIIDHGFGLLSSYSHLSKINVVENQIVKKNEKIGEIGATGRVTGPHLHWTVYFEKIRINPELIIQENFLKKLLLNQK